jgi:hypothetical protein
LVWRYEREEGNVPVGEGDSPQRTQRKIRKRRVKERVEG